jgi:protein tyrosine phosphatase (PTP) superfamily phosphohydrolase (DUF442 family)
MMNVANGVVLFCLLFGLARALPQGVKDKKVDDLPHYLEVTPLIGTGGQMTDAGIQQLVEKGYRAVINLRTAEEGVDLEAEQKFVEKEGMAYYAIPLSGKSPEAGQAAQFLDLMEHLREKRVFVHCATANRVGSLMMIKRVLQDGLTLDQASAEAARVGLRSDTLRQFALDMIEQRQKRK